MRYITSSPTEVTFTLSKGDPALQPADLEQIAEIFKTPLTGAYNWDYAAADQRIRKLYRLGKERNWDTDQHIDWTQNFPRTEKPHVIVPGMPDPYAGWAPYDALNAAEQLDFGWHCFAWTLSQFLHGEQGALLVASQLVSCAPSYDAKLYAASQTFDEARHVEAFSRYLNEKVGIVYPVNAHLKALLDKILTDERWDLKFIGMQLVIESLALAAFQVQLEFTADPLLRDIIGLIVRDEARHVAFGVHYMEQFVKSLPTSEVDARAQFAFEACRVMRERIVPTDVYVHYGFDVEEGRRRFLDAGHMDMFRNLLFARIVPNLQRVGLITPRVEASYAELGLMQYASLPSDAEIDWAKLSEPLPERARSRVSMLVPAGEAAAPESSVA